VLGSSDLGPPSRHRHAAPLRHRRGRPTIGKGRPWSSGAGGTWCTPASTGPASGIIPVRSGVAGIGSGRLPVPDATWTSQEGKLCHLRGGISRPASKSMPEAWPAALSSSRTRRC